MASSTTARTGTGTSRATSAGGSSARRRTAGPGSSSCTRASAPDKNRQFYTEPEAQARWIEVLVDLVDELGLDGINVDVESLPREHVLDYGLFVGRLREALRARLPNAQVSVATQANDLGAAMAAGAAVAGADRIFMMAYDYHWAGSEPGASAPIDRLDGDERDLVWSLDRVRGAGRAGRPDDPGPAAVRDDVAGDRSGGRGRHRPGGATRGSRGGTSECSRTPRSSRQYEPIESVEFYAVPSPPASPAGPTPPGASGVPRVESWTAVYYDSPRSLAPKLALADDRGLAGAGFWAIGYERGLPDYTELIATFRAGRLGDP